MSPTQMLPVLAVVLAAALLRSTLGFGDALLAMPLLTLLIGIQSSTPLVALISSTIALSMLLGNWRGVDLQATWRLILSTVLGIPLGILLLKAAPEALVKGVLGGILVGFGLYQCFRPRLPRLPWEWLAYPFGFVAGLLGGAYNTNGPPVIVYGVLRHWSPERFRATLQGYFFPSGLFVLLSHGLAGLWTPDVLRLYLCALPLVLLAIWLGERLSRRIRGEQFQRIVYAGLVVLGLFMFF